MPLCSMTGFGQAEVVSPSGKFRVEIRGVNGRFLEIQFRMPRSFASLEAQLKTLISSKVSRGSVTVNIFWEFEENEASLGWDKKAVDRYMAIFQEIRKKYQLKDDITLSHLLNFNDIIKKETIEYSDVTLWKHLKPAMEKALDDFNVSRKREATFILSDLKKMVAAINKTVGLVEQRAPVRLKKYTTDLQKKIEQLTGKSMDPMRLATEVAIMGDRLDIAEECTRLRAHTGKLLADFKSDEPVGKRLGFILQEMNREANTIGSKANDEKISHWSVDLKENIEKIREQVSNFE